MAAAGDHAPAGLFSGVWSRLHAAASSWRRRGWPPGNGDGGDEEEEETAVRSRLARRAAAARRLGRKLAFVSFNLEVLVFVYAFWRARRRSLSWRLPTQALPILVVPALATLIYAAFVRFTRTLDLKDKKRLERLQEDKQQTDVEPRELDQGVQTDVQDYDGMDDASSSSAMPDSVPNTPRLRKRRQSSINKRDDGGADMAWGHSKDFQPMPSDGLRHRTFSSAKTYMTNSSFTESSEENTQKRRSVSAYSDQHVHIPVSTEDTVSHPSDDHSGSDLSSMLAQPANIPQELPAGDGEREEEFDGLWGITDTYSSKDNLVPPAGPHNSFCDRDDSRSSELAIATAFQELLVKGVKEKALVEPPHASAALQMYCFTSEDNPTWCAVHDKELNSDVETYLLPPICSDVQDNAPVVNIDAVNPKWNLLLKLYGNEVEETKLSKFHIPEENTRPKSCLGTREFSLCSQKTKKLEIVMEGSEDDIEEESCELNTHEENAALINMEEEALQDPLLLSTSTSEQCLEASDVSSLQDPLLLSTSTSEQCLEASDVSSCIHDAKAREVPGIINFVTAHPELVYTPSSEVLTEFEEDKTSDLHLPENNDVSFSFEEHPILDSPVADTALLLAPLYTEEVEITEVHDVVKEGCFESEDEEAFNHHKLAVTTSNDDSNTRNLTSDSIPVQFIPNTDINEALEAGEEASPEPLRESSCHTEEIFLSSGETSNDEVYSSDSNSYAKLLEGLSKYQDSPIFLNEVKNAAIVDSDAAIPKLSLQTELHGGGVEENELSKYHVPEEIRTPFNLEEAVVLSPPAVNDGSLFRQLKFICQSVGTPEFSLCNQESKGMEVAGSVSFIDDSPELSFLSSPELVAEGGEEAREKEAGGLNTEEENAPIINLEDEVLEGELVVSTTDQSLETSEFSLSSQGAKMTEVPGIVSSFTASPELSYPAFPELLAEGDQDLKGDETSDLPLHEQKGLPFYLEEPFLDPVVVDTAEDAVVTSELLICSEEVKMTEVHGVVKEVLSESEDEGAFDHQKLVLTSPDDDGITQTLISNSISAQFIPDASVKEGSQAGYEALLQPPHESTCQSEGAFSSSGEFDEVKAEAPFVGQEGRSNSDDEMALTPLDTSILLDEVRSAEALTDNPATSLSIPDSNEIQSLHDHEQDPSETLQEVTFVLDGSHTSSDEGKNSEIFSLYSRSSSCVSEINILETLRSGTSSESQSDRGISSDESNPVAFPNMDSTESNTNDPVTTEFILETNIIETPNAAEELAAGSPPEISSNFLGTFVAPDVINGMTESDKHLDLSSSSFAPVIDAFESLETGQGFSELQSEIDFTVQETLMSPNEVNNAENHFTDTVGYPQDSERTAVVALLDEDLTLRRAYMSPEDESDVQNSLADEYASDLPQMVESHCVSKKWSPESQDPLSSEEILVYPDEGSNAEPWGDPQDREDEDLTLQSPEDTSDIENSLADDYASDLPHTVESHCVSEKLSAEFQDPLSSQGLFYPDEGSTAKNDFGAYSPLCSTEVNLAEPWSIDQEGTQHHDEIMLGSEDIYMVDQEANSENLGNNSGSLDIPDATMTDSLRGADIVSSEILYDGMSSFEGTLLSFDGDDAEEDSPNNSGSVTDTAQINSASRLGLQEGSLKPEGEKAINSMSPYEVDTGETTYSSVATKDKEPKEDGESKDMKEDVEDSEDDHESNPIGTFGVDEITASLAPKPSVELSANDASWRDAALIGTSYDFDMAVRKPVVAISGSNGSSTMFELADVQYTALDDDDDDDDGTETLGAPLPSSVATE
ncbi:unnamed protein product [Alopecurus aequalis]